jgi:hypothetical protein
LNIGVEVDTIKDMGFLRTSFVGTLVLCGLMVAAGIVLAVVGGMQQSSLSLFGVEVTTTSAGLAAIVTGAALCGLAVRRHLDSFDKIPAKDRGADLRSRRRKFAITITVALGAVPVVLGLSTVTMMGGSTGDTSALPGQGHLATVDDGGVPNLTGDGGMLSRFAQMVQAPARHRPDGGTPDGGVEPDAQTMVPR